jgi:hypothetical protein
MARAKASFWTKSLDKLKGAFAHAEPEPAPRASKKKSERKKPEQKKPAQPPRTATVTAEASTAAPDAGAATKAHDETPKKKIPAQPWYRHRQRW